MKTYLSAIIIAVAVLISVLLLTRAYKYRFTSTETVSVVGLAEVDFTSDLVVWEGNFSRKSQELRLAYSSLKDDEQVISQYLVANGIPDSSFVFSAIDINKEYTNTYDRNGELSGKIFAGYTLSQHVNIESKDIAKVEKLSRQVTGLIEKGIEFNSMAPLYFYTRLADLKMDLLAKASTDARARAETIAGSVKSRLGKPVKANMGVFQITGKNKNEDFSYGGSFNTADKFKTASITIRMDYLLD